MVKFGTADGPVASNRRCLHSGQPTMLAWSLGKPVQNLRPLPNLQSLAQRNGHNPCWTSPWQVSDFSRPFWTWSSSAWSQRSSEANLKDKASYLWTCASSVVGWWYPPSQTVWHPKCKSSACLGERQSPCLVGYWWLWLTDPIDVLNWKTIYY